MVLERTTTHIVRLQREKNSRDKGDEVGVTYECLKVFGKFNRSVTKSFTVLTQQKNTGPILFNRFAMFLKK